MQEMPRLLTLILILWVGNIHACIKWFRVAISSLIFCIFLPFIDGHDDNFHLEMQMTLS